MFALLGRCATFSRGRVLASGKSPACLLGRNTPVGRGCCQVCCPGTSSNQDEAVAVLGGCESKSSWVSFSRSLWQAPGVSIAARSATTSGFDSDNNRQRKRKKRLRSDCDPLYTEKVEEFYPTTLKQKKVGARVLQALLDVIEKDTRLFDLLFDDLGVNLQEVRMTPDSKTAYVRWTAKEGYEDKAESVLIRSAGLLKSRLARALPYRRGPSLYFVSDYLTDEESELEDLFDRIKREREEQESSTDK